MFFLFHKNYGKKCIYSINHPIPNDELTELFLFYDPVHLLKSIRNNWCTEKTQQTDVDKWNDIISIYKKEAEGLLKETNPSFAAPYPTNFEKQKVSLALQIFDEKTVTALEIQGSKETARFVQLVLRVWKCLIVKSPDTGFRQFDDDKKPFAYIEDPRLLYLQSMATIFKGMDLILPQLKLENWDLQLTLVMHCI